MKRKLIIYALLAVFLIGTAVFAADEWTMFRRTPQRTGAVDPNTIGVAVPSPVWIFPRFAGNMDPVDNSDGVPNFTTTGAWTAAPAGTENAVDGHEGNYAYTGDVYSVDEQWESFAGDSATWTYNLNTIDTPDASFLVYVWIPGFDVTKGAKRVNDAHYIIRRTREVALGVFDTVVLGRVAIDQNVGGVWINLGGRAFNFELNDVLTITVTAETQVDSADDRIVIADAVQLVQDAGMVISSPVSCVDPASPYVISAVNHNRDAGPIGDTVDTRTVGVVYGIGRELDSGLATSTDDRGFEIWRFPANPDNWIAGGFTSSPSLATIGGNEIAFIPGCDGQVYAIDTSDGTLLWQGPGYVYDDNDNVGGDDNPDVDLDHITTTGVWTDAVHPGYQGLNYSHVAAAATADATFQWTPDNLTPGNYSIFAWIPTSTTVERYINDARYSISYGSAIETDNDYTGIDIPGFNASPRGTGAGDWKDSDPNAANRAPGAVNDNYLWVSTQYSAVQIGANYSGPKAVWGFDITESGSFGIQAWFPSDSANEAPYVHSEDAHYYVTVDKTANGGSVTTSPIFKVNQRAGEAWINVTTQSFQAEAGDKIYVYLTNESNLPFDAGDPSPRIVIADAVRIVKQTTAVVDQSVGGRWVKLGGDYNLTAADIASLTITLDNRTGMRDSSNLVPATAFVAADAMKIVPAELGSYTLEDNEEWRSVFDFSSPLVEDNGDGTADVFVASTRGRVYGLRYNPVTTMQEPVWTFPGVSPFQNPAGEFNATPAMNAAGDTIYIGSRDGHVYAIDPATGAQRWVYPLIGPDTDGITYSLGEITSTTVVGNALHVAIGSDSTSRGFIHGTSGRIVALDMNAVATVGTDAANGGAGRELWWYPDVATNAKGAYLLSSPLLMTRAGDANPSLFTASTDGRLYAVDAATGAGYVESGAWSTFGTAYPDLMDTVYSSPAGIVNGASTYMFVGTQGGQLRMLNLDNPYATDPWFYNLFGPVTSSPAVERQRVFIGDGAGFTWAFSPDGSEGWNDQLGDIPSTGSNPTAAFPWQERVDADIFTEADFNDFIGMAQASATSKFPITLGYEDPHLKARDAAASPAKHKYEWGEKICVIAWNLVDPTYNPNDGSRIHPTNPVFNTPLSNSTMTLTVKGSDPGDQSDSTDTVNFSPSGTTGYYMIDDPTAPEGTRPVYYAAYTYIVDGSSGKMQAPGTSIRMTVREKPANTLNPSNEVYVPQHAIPRDGSGNPLQRNYLPQDFSINNPLGLVYGGTGIGVTPGTFTTSHDDPLANVNGNTASIPTVDFLTVGHGTTSDKAEMLLVDRSHLGTLGRELRARVQSQDLAYQWGGNVSNIFGYLPWEILPPLASSNQPNVSEDYPDIRGRQFSSLVQGNVEATSEAVDLPGTTATIPVPATWSTSGKAAHLSVAIPQFQPANEVGGYSGGGFVYVDSNNNGQLEKPADLTSSRIILRKVGSASSEAYREFATQVQVPVDRRVEIESNVLDIGAVPHGFGWTPDATGQPELFFPSWAGTYANPPSGFRTWFKPFTAKNLGNTNLTNVKLARRVQDPLGNETTLALFSDTVQDDAYGGSGYGILSTDAASALDLDYLDLVPTPGVTTRTFHKARVGDNAPTLRVPDDPPGVAVTGSILPQLSVAVRPGTPVGTYSGTFTLFEDLANPDVYDMNPASGEFIGDPAIKVAVTVNEARLTSGDDLKSGSMAHLDDGLPANKAAGNMTPAAFRDPVSNDLYMALSSSRYPFGTKANPNDPWYLYLSAMPYDSTDEEWTFADYDSATDPFHWWFPTADSAASGKTPPYPNPLDMANPAYTFFPAHPNGLRGDILKDTIKFANPSFTWDWPDTDPATRRAWMFFSGQSVKDLGAVAGQNVGAQRRSTENRLFYVELTDPADPLNLTLDNKTAYSPIADWTMPKFGLRGLATRMSAANNLWLWSFWYGGSNDKWRIYYTANPTPDGDGTTAGHLTWLNAAQLPIPNGLTAIAEPSPIYRRTYTYAIGGVETPTSDLLDVVYTGYSSFHKNSDIYLSRFKPGVSGIKTKKDVKYLEMTPQKLRMRYVDWYLDPATTISWSRIPSLTHTMPFTTLERQASTPVWSAKEVDWDTASTLRVFVFLNKDNGTTAIEVTSGDPEKDSKTGALAYTYPLPRDANQQEAYVNFRGVVIDPASGSVKFLRPPGSNARVVATFTPKAYRLTTDAVADVSPFALFDQESNPRWDPTMGNSLPFYDADDWASDDPNSGPRVPKVDRLWLFWRRPGLNQPGTGIHYRTYRYSVKLGEQIAKPADLKHSVTVQLRNPSTGLYEAMTTPVEIDWVRNRLHFMSEEDGKEVLIDYTDKDGDPGQVRGIVSLEEELGPGAGSAFGNLTKVMVNEGQVYAVKDPIETGKVWVFWSSARSGNTDVYYEAISPRFYGPEYAP